MHHLVPDARDRQSSAGRDQTGRLLRMPFSGIVPVIVDDRDDQAHTGTTDSRVGHQTGPRPVAESGVRRSDRPRCE